MKVKYFIVYFFILLTNNMVFAEDSSGARIINNACVSCHNVVGSEKIGPTLTNIQKIYRQKYPTREAFVDGIKSYIKDPVLDKSLFKDSILKYGLMPLVSLSTENMDSVAKYIYSADLREFENHLAVHSTTETSFEKGERISQSAKAMIGQNLMMALNSKGTIGAVEFCNLKAQIITQDQSKENSVKIKRVSDRPRNKINQANSTELKLIENYKKDLKNGKELSSHLIEEKEVYKFYSPIKINQMCLQCHGQKYEEVLPETFKSIKAKYPEDKAMSYKDGDLRGIWSLEWKK